jgi:hypothetical protein
MKNPHGRTGNRTRDLIISSQKLWPLDHEAGHILIYRIIHSSPAMVPFHIEVIRNNYILDGW